MYILRLSIRNITRAIARRNRNRRHQRGYRAKRSRRPKDDRRVLLAILGRKTPQEHEQGGTRTRRKRDELNRSNTAGIRNHMSRSKNSKIQRSIARSSADVEYARHTHDVGVIIFLSNRSHETRSTHGQEPTRGASNSGSILGATTSGNSRNSGRRRMQRHRRSIHATRSSHVPSTTMRANRDARSRASRHKGHNNRGSSERQGTHAMSGTSRGITAGNINTGQILYAQDRRQHLNRNNQIKDHQQARPKLDPRVYNRNGRGSSSSPTSASGNRLILTGALGDITPRHTKLNKDEYNLNNNDLLLELEVDFLRRACLP